MYESLARRLRVLRAARGITLAKAEELTGVTRETLGALEHGQRGAYTSTLEKIADGYGTTVGALLAEEEPEVSPTGKASAPPETGRASLPSSIEELLERRNTKTRHLANPNLLAALTDDSRPLADAVRMVREATEELKAIAPDVVRLGQLGDDLFNEVSKQAFFTKLALPARLGQKFVPIQLGTPSEADEALPELTPEQKAEINEAMRKLEEVRRPLEAVRA